MLAGLLLDLSLLDQYMFKFRSGTLAAAALFLARVTAAYYSKVRLHRLLMCCVGVAVLLYTVVLFASASIVAEIFSRVSKWPLRNGLCYPLAMREVWSSVVASSSPPSPLNATCTTQSFCCSDNDHRGVYPCRRRSG